MKLASRARTAALATTAAGLIAVVAAALLVGSRGPGSALLGLGMVLAFFGAGALPLAVVGDGSQPGFAFLILGMTYVLRILLGVVIYVMASTASWVHTGTVGLTVIGCALVWTNTQLALGLSRKHQPTLDV